MKLPETLHAKWQENGNADPWIETGDVEDLAGAAGETVTIGVYKLMRTFKAKTVVQASDIRKR